VDELLTTEVESDPRDLVTGYLSEINANTIPLSSSVPGSSLLLAGFLYPRQSRTVSIYRISLVCLPAMASVRLRLISLIAGTGLGVLSGSLIPNHHYPAFRHHALVLPFIFGDVWDYELWGHTLGLLITILVWIRYRLPIALRFGLGYAVSFSTLIYARSPESHLILPTLLGPILAVLAAIAVAEISAIGVKSLLRNQTLTPKKWASWSAPTKLNIYMGAIGVLGFVLAALSLFGLQAYDIIPGLDRPRTELLRYVHFGNEVILYGNDGSTVEQSIQINGARSDGAGVFAEYYWLNIYYPRYQPMQQRLMARTDPQYPEVITRRKSDGTLITIHTDDKSALPRYFDQIVIENWLGRRTQVYFDITEFAHGFDEKGNPIKFTGKRAEKVLGAVMHQEFIDWRFPFNR